MRVFNVDAAYKDRTEPVHTDMDLKDMTNRGWVVGASGADVSFADCQAVRWCNLKPIGRYMKCGENNIWPNKNSSSSIAAAVAVAAAATAA